MSLINQVFGVSLAKIPENAIVATNNKQEFVDTSARYLEDGTVFFPKLAVASESIDVGAEVVLTDTASSTGFRRNSDGLSRFIPSVMIDEDGYRPLKRSELKERIAVSQNQSEAETNNNNSIQFDYFANFIFTSDGIILRTAGEVANFQLTVQKFIGTYPSSGEFKTIRYLVPQSSYDEGYGAFIVDALPAEPDARARYFIRDTGTGQVTIDIQDATLVEVDENDDPIVFRIKLDTTDVNGLQLKGSTIDLLGLGAQFYPWLQSTGYDTSLLEVADLRDVNREHRTIDANRTLTSKNDFFTNRHDLLDYRGEYTVQFSTPDLWREGDSLEMLCTDGKGTLIIDGYTINGLSSFTGLKNHRYLVKIDQLESSNFLTTEVSGIHRGIKYIDASQTVDAEAIYGVDTTAGAVTLTIDGDAVESFEVFDANEKFNANNCIIVFPSPTGTVTINKRNDSFSFYKTPAGVWRYREFEQGSAGVV